MRSAANQLDDFIKGPNRNAWIKVSENGVRLELYIRKGIKDGQFQLANMISSRPGNGAFGSYLPKLEAKLKESGFTSMFVENIHNRRLVGFFSKRGYQIEGQFCVCAEKELT